MDSTPKRKHSWEKAFRLKDEKRPKHKSKRGPKGKEEPGKKQITRCLVARCCKTPNTNIEPYPLSKKMNVLTCYNMALAKTCEQVLAHT